MAIHEVDPISRIEGHLGIEVETDASGNIIEANAHGNLWRGFENFLLGRDVNDAITFTQRICGVCPVPHGMTATFAADTVLGYSAGHITFAYDGSDGVPAKAVLIRNLVLSAEFLMSSITHFYHLAAPSYVQGPAIPPWTPYFANSYYSPLLLSGGRALPEHTIDGTFSDDLWSTVIRSYVVALKIRRLTFEAGALFAGRMPMTSCLVAGGVTFNGQEALADRCDAFQDLIATVGAFIVKEYVPIALALGALYSAYDNTDNGGSGFGAGLGRFLAWGGFPNLDDTLTLPGGVLDTNALATNFTVANRADVASKFLAGGTNAVPDNLMEYISNSRYDVADADVAVYDASGGAYPGDVSRTMPARANGYTYMKAPRWEGYACEVGPLARLAVAGYYPVTGATLAATVPGYTEYVRVVNAVTGLDPRMIEPDIAVALVREGAATLRVWDGAAWTNVDNGAAGVDINTLPAGTIAEAYTATGAFAGTEAVITDGPVIGLTTYIYTLQGGLSLMDRLRARALESLVLVQKMIGGYNKAAGTFDETLFLGSPSWINELKGEADGAGTTWRTRPPLTAEAQGWGGTEAPRGALMHQVTITAAGKIKKYQCIVPTTWNGSPKATTPAGLERGAIEEACIDVPFAATNCPTGLSGAVASVGGVEVLRVAQSFDPCIACAVH